MCPSVLAAPTAPPRLRDNRNFRRLWAAQAVSTTGSAVSSVALPIIAAVMLDATPAQMGLLTATAAAPALLVWLAGSVWADASGKRVPVMVACDVVNALLVASVALLWLTGSLNFALLLAVLGGMSVTSVLAETFSAPVLPEILLPEQLMAATGRFGATRGAAEIAGPGLAGVLIQLFSAPVAVLADSLSFLAAAVLTKGVHLPATPATDHTDEPETPEPAATRSLFAGFAAVFHQPFLRNCVLAVGYLSLANGVVSALLVLYMVRTLHLPATLVGPVLGAGALGGVLASLAASAAHRRLGPVRLVSGAIGLLTVSFALLPFARSGGFGVLACLNYELTGSFGAALLVTTLFCEIPVRASRSVLARALAVTTLIPTAATLVGALLGGAVATRLGTQTALGASLAFTVLANAALLITILTKGTKSGVALPG